MRILRLAPGSPPAGLGRPVATIGNFDGVHRGHQAIVADTIRRARAAREPALVITFDPHPVKVLHPEAGFRCLKTLDQRLRALARLGLDATAVIRFDAALAALDPRDFAGEILARILAVSAVLVGPNFRFGRDRSGDLARLQALGAELGFTAHGFPPVEDERGPISSTRIREALGRGDVAGAAALLGRPFPISGVVVRGRGRGRALGFPTANLATENECLPAPGVYATRVLLRGAEWRAATFIGRPETFGETGAVVETHILDWDGPDLYGERLELGFLGRLRGPVRFASPEELAAQLARDVAAARGA